MAVAAAEARTLPRSQHLAEPLPDEESHRARIYWLLARLLAAAADKPLLSGLTTLSGDDSHLGLAFATLAQAARSATPEGVAEEYHELFIGLTRGELSPYGSSYLTGFLNGTPPAVLQG